MKKPGANEEWKAWGKVDPLYGVASWEGRDKAGPNAWTPEEFYAVGQSDWHDFSRRWERYGLVPDCCLEIGCGAGRITKPLAMRFLRVHALDVSQDMIDYARAHIDAANIEYHLSDGHGVPLPDDSVSAVFSTHVFQHFDSLDTARSYFEEIARVLRRGGSMMIHLPIHSWPTLPGVFSRLYEAKKRLGDARAFARQKLLELGIGKPFMRGLSYPVDLFYEQLPRLGLSDVEISVFATRSNDAPHPFVFATRG
jgi:SAM-dependent methyltransferase